MIIIIILNNHQRTNSERNSLFVSNFKKGSHDLQHKLITRIESRHIYHVAWRGSIPLGALTVTLQLLFDFNERLSAFVASKQRHERWNGNGGTGRKHFVCNGWEADEHERLLEAWRFSSGRCTFPLGTVIQSELCWQFSRLNPHEVSSVSCVFIASLLSPPILVSDGLKMLPIVYDACPNFVSIIDSITYIYITG